MSSQSRPVPAKSVTTGNSTEHVARRSGGSWGRGTSRPAGTHRLHRAALPRGRPQRQLGAAVLQPSPCVQPGIRGIIPADWRRAATRGAPSTGRSHLQRPSVGSSRVGGGGLPGGPGPAAHASSRPRLGARHEALPLVVQLLRVRMGSDGIIVSLAGLPGQKANAGFAAGLFTLVGGGELEIRRGRVDGRAGCGRKPMGTTCSRWTTKARMSPGVRSPSSRF